MRKGSGAVALALLSAIVFVSAAYAQDGRSVVLRTNGQVLLKDAEGDFGMLEINLHNSNWQYGSQTEATAKCEDVVGGGKRCTGVIPVPQVVGAALSFLETITPGEDGLKIVYEIQPAGPLVLNGLQVSLVLPTDRFGGEQLVVKSAEAPERRVALPRTLNPAQWQLGTIEGNAVQIGADEATALTMTINKTYGLIIHDLRQWERDEFEIRIPIIQEDKGKMLSTTDRFSVEITLGPGEIAVTGP